MQRSNISHYLPVVAIGLALAAYPLLTYSQNTVPPPGLTRAKKPVPNHYIVVLKQPASGVRSLPESAAAISQSLAMQYGGRLRSIYQHAIQGFSIETSEGQALALAKDPRVAYVEEDGLVSITTTQTPVSWGPDRIDQRLGIDNTYNYTYNGAGVHVYVLDTGLRNNADFGNRVVVTNPPADFVHDGRNGDDCNGHGTWVASILGSGKYGVAKGVTIHPVRVLGCAGDGYVSDVVAGVEWVTNNKLQPAVANMSLITSSPSISVDIAVRNSIAAGVTYVVGAGNDNRDASNGSPARVAEAITVAATDWSDNRWLDLPSGSNFGPLVDLFAPGVNIAGFTNTGSFWAASGTSGASPHVAGVAAMYLQANPSADPATVANAIRAAATKNVVQNPGAGSPNNLLYENFPIASVSITGQEQYECIASRTSECARVVFDTGTVTVTVNGRAYTASYGTSSTRTTIASALAARINSDPSVIASSTGSVITLVSRTFACYTVSGASSTSQPAMFSPSFTATATAPNCP